MLSPRGWVRLVGQNGHQFPPSDPGPLKSSCPDRCPMDMVLLSLPQAICGVRRQISAVTGKAQASKFEFRSQPVSCLLVFMSW